MSSSVFNHQRTQIPCHQIDTLVVGSGCAAFQAADSLVDLGHTNIAMVTEGINMGTSRNTGSDKQTYYKLSLASSAPDSVYAMAQALYAGESVHGDTALVEAALSTRCFYKLVQLGVPFPQDKYGQYVGYQTDHDNSQRATSCGPLTSKFMTEKLEASVNRKGVNILSGIRIVRLLTEEVDGVPHIVGALGIDRKAASPDQSLVLFQCQNVVYATGGPSGIYHSSVFPQSQTCATGAALLCGAKGNNVGEWQYGIGSTKFRWNLSGTFQQVVPCYISTAQDGSDPQEFLMDYFSSPQEMLTAVFLKGYQWPFDPAKTGKGGSSLVDLAVFTEMNQKGRRVFLDYTKNPSIAENEGEFDFSLLLPEAKSYLEQSKVLFGTPIQRLLTMNRPAYDLYLSHDIDLSKDLLEIAVCAQHNNGGLKADLWWQSNVKGLFPVGEVCGNFGVHRPGGSALNAGQVGGLRAAQYISHQPQVDAPPFSHVANQAVEEILALCAQLTCPQQIKKNPLQWRERYQKEMDLCGAFLRKLPEIQMQIHRCRHYLATFSAETTVENTTDFINALINQDILITQLVYLSGMEAYISSGGESRGSYLIDRGNISYSNCKTNGLATTLDCGKHSKTAQEVSLSGLEVTTETVPCRPLPDDGCWFETVYNDFLHDNIIGTT